MPFPAPPTVTLRVSRDGRDEVRNIIRNLALAGRAFVEISPSGVLHGLSDALNRKVLAMIKPAHEAKSRSDSADKIGEAATGGSREGVVKALRYYAYRYIELLWKSASEGHWGTTAKATALDKYQEGSPFPGAWGVRKRGKGAWYGVLKGRTQPANAHDAGADGRTGSTAEIKVVIGR